MRNIFTVFFLGSALLLFGCSSPQEENGELKEKKTANFSILAMGDSLTEGYGLANPEEDSYPAQLEKKLQASGFSVGVENAGISGETSTGGLGRTAWIAESKPDMVLLFLGANDMLRGINPDITEKNISAIVDAFQKEGVPVLLLPMQAQSSLGAVYKKRFDGLYSRIADKKGVPITMFPLENVALVPSLNISDGIHPNPEGYSIVVENIYPAVEKEIQKL